MKLESVDAILHPPELKGRERLRYWLAVSAFLPIAATLLLLTGGGVVLVLWSLETSLGEEAVAPYVEFFMFSILVCGLMSVFLGDRLWTRLFLKSGYLSDAAAIRILSNRAPTRKGERRHRWLGQAILLLIYGILGGMAVWGGQWWVLVIVVPLAVWGVFLIRNAWKDVDSMLAGGPIPPESEERMRYIEKVLDERRHRESENP
jgi:hypothetical protein